MSCHSTNAHWLVLQTMQIATFFSMLRCHDLKKNYFTAQHIPFRGPPLICFLVAAAPSPQLLPHSSPTSPFPRLFLVTPHANPPILRSAPSHISSCVPLSLFTAPLPHQNRPPTRTTPSATVYPRAQLYAPPAVSNLRYHLINFQPPHLHHHHRGGADRYPFRSHSVTISRHPILLRSPWSLWWSRRHVIRCPHASPTCPCRHERRPYWPLHPRQYHRRMVHHNPRQRRPRNPFTIRSRLFRPSRTHLSHVCLRHIRHG